MLSFTQSSIADVDDKYVKAGSRPTSMSKLISMTTFQVYACFLMVCSVSYYALGGNIRNASSEDKLAYLSCLAEGFGLLSLRIKIQRQQSVSGISAMTMVLQLASLLMVLDVVRSVSMTYRKSYQEDLDVLHVKYLIPSCVVLAVVLHPQFSQGTWFSFCWTTYLYLDCLALMPQVVMMTRGAGKVEAPVSHFVAATALSRVMDLSFWYYNFDLGSQGSYRGFNYSGWLIVFWHLVNLAIVADFMYYYVKARFSGKAMSEDLALPLVEV